jgi:signal transduction histidine kinase
VSLLLRSRSSEQSGEGWEYLAGIKQSVEQMERLIRDLLEIKRIEAGHLSLVWETTTVSSLFDDTLEMMGPLARGKDIEVSVSIARGTPSVRADRERILQVLSNLVGNAVKFTQPGGAVEMGAEARGSDVMVWVRDNGPGIEARHLDQIFDRFWQAHRNRREGIGLGLAIVRSIVEAHGGRVWAESKVGVGTIVRFTLPPASDARLPDRVRS